MAEPSSETSTTQNANTVFIDTNLNTHLALTVSHADTVSHLKKNILFEHPICFPSLGDIKINAIKVKRRGHFYHLSDSMLVKSAFDGINKCWFLSVDASSSREQNEGQVPLNLDSSNRVNMKAIITHPLANGFDLLPSNLSRDIPESTKLEGECANDEYCKHSIADTNKRLDPVVQEKNVNGRPKETTGTEEDCRSLSPHSNGRSDHMVDDLSKGAESSGKHTTSKVGKMKNNIFDDVVDTRSKSKRSLKPPKSSRPAKKRKTKGKSGLDNSSKEINTSFIVSDKKASELDVTILQHPSEYDQKSKDVEGKRRKKRKSSVHQDHVVSAVLSSGTARAVHEDAEKKPYSTPIIEKDIQAIVQSEVRSCGFTVNSKQTDLVEKIDIDKKSSLSKDVKRMSTCAVEGVNSLKGDEVINGKGQPPVDNEDRKDQYLQIGASSSEKIILNDNYNSASHQMDDTGKERALSEKTEHRLTAAEMVMPLTDEEGKTHFEKSVVLAVASDASGMAGQKESTKKRKKPRGTQSPNKDTTIAAGPEVFNSSVGVSSLNSDGAINDKGQCSVVMGDANNANQQAGTSRGENDSLNNNCNSVSHPVDIGKERELLEENDQRSTVAEILRPSTYGEGKSPLEKSSEMAEQEKSTKKRKKLKGKKKSNEEVTIAAVAKAVNSSIEGVQSLNNGVIYSKGQLSLDIGDAKNCNLQIGASIGKDIIPNNNYNSISHPMENIGKEGELFVKNDHRSTAIETLSPSTREGGKTRLKKSVVPSKIFDASEVTGQKESTKKRKKRKEIKESNEKAVVSVGITYWRSYKKEYINVDHSDDKIRKMESILSEPLGKDLSDSETRKSPPVAARTEAAKESGGNLVFEVKKSKKKRDSAKDPPDHKIRGKHVSKGDLGLAIKHADEEASFEVTKKTNVVEARFASQLSDPNWERQRANAVDDGHGITQQNYGNIEFPVSSHAGNIESSLQLVTNDGTVDGTKTGKVICSESDRINFGVYSVPKQHPNEGIAAAEKVTTSIKSAKENNKKRAMDFEAASDLQSLPKSNENQNREEEPKVVESNSIQHHGSSSKDEHGEFMRPTSKKYPEDTVKGLKVQASSNSNQLPSVSGKSRKPSVNEYAIDLRNGGGFASPYSSLESFKRVTKLNKKRNGAAKVSSVKNNVEAVDGSDQEKRLLTKSSQSIWDESSDDEKTNNDSSSSTRTPSDNNSLSSADSDGESTTTLSSSRTGPLYSKGKKDSGDMSAKLRSTAQKSMTMDKILRSSIRYKKAKLTASQSEIEDTESRRVPDSQPNL